MSALSTAPGRLDYFALFEMPRKLWIAGAASVIAWQVSAGRPGAALLLLAAFAPLAALPRRSAGPLERTVLELRRIDRDAVWRRPRVGRTRLLLRESDALIDLIERCRERDDRLLPTQLWSAVVRAVGEVDSDLRDELGINRDPDHVADVLFTAQEVLLARVREARRPALAPIIPLFRELERRAAAGP